MSTLLLYAFPLLHVCLDRIKTFIINKFYPLDQNKLKMTVMEDLERREKELKAAVSWFLFQFYFNFCCFQWFWEAALHKKCSKNMQQIYWRTPTAKCDFSSCFATLCGIPHGYSPVNLLHIFRTRFYKNTSGELLLGSVSRSSHQRCSIKKMFLKILQNSQESTCVGVSF